MINIERILCPTDLSTEADEALRYALALTTAFKAKLILVYCKREASVADWVTGSRARELFETSLFSRLDANELKTLDWTSVVCTGDNVAAIISNVAEAKNVDLIVMRSRRRPYAAVLLGSTAEAVCRDAPCPVLITHPNEVEWVGLSTEEIDLHRILVAHDSSPDSGVALRYGCSLAEAYQAELHLLHVLETAGREEPELAWAKPNANGAYRLLADQMQRSLPEEAFLWCGIVNSIRYGKAHEQVLTYSREHEIELICLGASGYNWKNGFLGSTVDRVLREAPCPVLVTRPIRHREPRVELKNAPLGDT